MSTPEGSPSISHFNRHSLPNKIIPGIPRIGNLFSFLYKSICFIQ